MWKKEAMNSINEQKIKDLCRVCSCEGQFDIHKRIPKWAFEYKPSLEYNQWTKPIAILMEECTGTSVNLYSLLR